MTAVEMIGDAVSVLADDYGQAFTVDGEEGSFTGILATPSATQALELGGFQPGEVAQLVLKKPTTLVPHIGLRITARGVSYHIARIDDEQTHYAFGLTGVDQ